MNIDEGRKVLIAYHANCIDGFTSAWACWRGLIDTTSVLSDDIDFIAMTYDEQKAILYKAAEYDVIFMVDFSLSINTLRMMPSKPKLIIIDHHKTAFDMYSESFLPNTVYPHIFEHSNLYGATVIMNLKESGATLTWKYFFPEGPVPTLAKYVRDYDLYRFKFPETKFLNRYFRTQEKTIENWELLGHALENVERRNMLTMIGKHLDTYHNQIVIDLITNSAEPCELAGETGLCVNCSPHFKDEVGNLLAEQSGTFGATWQQEPNGKIKWSLRSIGDYDVSVIAAKFGYGGHRNAASFYLSTPTESVENLGITLWENE